MIQMLDQRIANQLRHRYASLLDGASHAIVHILGHQGRDLECPHSVCPPDKKRGTNTQAKTVCNRLTRPIRNASVKPFSCREDSMAESPLLDEPGRLWLLKTARRNFWRVEGMIDLDDLIGDGALCWQIVVAKYYPKVSARPQLMALFKTTYTNHIHRLANKRSKGPHPFDEIVSIDSDEADCYNHVAAPEEMHQYAAQASDIGVRALLHAIIDQPELLKKAHRRWLGGRRESTNDWLCRLAGLDPRLHAKLHSQLLAFLGPLKRQDMA
jgi:hypothetical protein